MSGSSNNPHTRAIAQFISQIRYEAIPNEVIGRIKLLILDSLGCALYGSALEWSRILRTTLARLDLYGCPSIGAYSSAKSADACRNTVLSENSIQLRFAS
jgi:2-methylcitrate dehydratase PrpD